MQGDAKFQSIKTFTLGICCMHQLPISQQDDTSLNLVRVLAYQKIREGSVAAVLFLGSDKSTLSHMDHKSSLSFYPHILHLPLYKPDFLLQNFLELDNYILKWEPQFCFVNQMKLNNHSSCFHEMQSVGTGKCRSKQLYNKYRSKWVEYNVYK